MTDVNLESVRAQLEIILFTKRKIKELKEVHDAAVEAVKAQMKPGDIGYLDEAPIVNWSSYKTSRFDQSAFGAEHPDLLEQYKAMKEVDKFDVVK